MAHVPYLPNVEAAHFEKATTALERHFPCCDAALLTGSAASGTMKKKSDFDIVVLYKDIKSSYRRIEEVDGDIVEFLIYPFEEAFRLIVDEGIERRNVMKILCGHSIVLKDSDGQAAKLRDASVKLLEEGPKPFSDFEKRQKRYIVTNRLDDFLECDDFTRSCFILQDMMPHLMEFLLVINGHWPYSGSGKWQAKSLKNYNGQCYQALTKALKNFYEHQDKKPLKDWINETLAPYGGNLKVGYSRGVPPQLNKKNTYFSIEIYYFSNQHTLLREIVLPLMQQLKGMIGVRQVYFDRHYTNGPHITVFVDTTSDIFDTVVKPVANRFLSESLEKFPSVCFVSEKVRSLPRAEQWYADNSIQFQGNDMEFSIYGGSNGWGAVKTLYEVSSFMVLKHIDHKESWSKIDGLNAALLCYLTGLKVLGIDGEMAKAFTKMHYTDKIMWAIGANDLPEGRRMERSFEEKFYQNENAFNKQVRDMIAALDAGIEIDGYEWLQGWLDALKKFKEQIQSLWKADQAIYLPLGEHEGQLWYTDTRYWIIYKQVLHTMINRLGPVYKEEAFIAFIVNQYAKTQQLINA